MSKEKDPTIIELLTTSQRDYLVNNKGENVNVRSALAGKVVGVYFSAHWCGPCRGFTPVFAQVYEQLKASGKPFEVVFSSMDRNDSAFKGYHASMPWLAIPFADRNTANELASRYSVNGIPALLLFDEEGHLMTTDGRTAITQDGAKAFPWTAYKGKISAGVGPGLQNILFLLLLAYLAWTFFLRK